MSFSSSSAADWYVEALSEIIILGSDLQLENRRKASINVGTVRSFTTSKCTARVFAQVNRQIYTLDMPWVDFTYISPVKSTPVTVNGWASLVQLAGSGGGSGIVYALPMVLRHVTQRRIIFLTYCRPVGIQYL